MLYRSYLTWSFNCSRNLLHARSTGLGKDIALQLKSRSLVFRPKGWFPLSRNSSVRTHVKCTCLNEIETVYERLRVKVKVEQDSWLIRIRDLPYIVSILFSRLRVVSHFSSGIVERAKHERAWKSPHARKGDMRRGERKMKKVKNFSLSLPRVAFSRVGWFLRALAFRSLYYPWGQMGDYSWSNLGT